MELWRAEEVKAKRPKVLDARSFGASIAIHVAFFAICFGFAACHMRKAPLQGHADRQAGRTEHRDNRRGADSQLSDDHKDQDHIRFPLLSPFFQRLWFLIQGAFPAGPRPGAADQSALMRSRIV